MVILDKSSFMKAISIAVFTLGSIMMPTTCNAKYRMLRFCIQRRLQERSGKSVTQVVTE
jgi:hypothetical protein